MFTRSAGDATPSNDQPLKPKTLQRWGTRSRRCLRAVRSLSPLAAAGITLAVVLGGAGVASAANGGNFLLGRFNGETATAYLSNSKGTPIKFDAPANAAPLKVSNSVEVPELNSQYLGGKSESELQPTGGDGVSGGVDIDEDGEEVASTGNLPAGDYYVNATSLVYVAANDDAAYCWIYNPSTDGTFDLGGQSVSSGVGTYIQAAETAPVAVTSGNNLQEWCDTDGFNGSFAYNSAITATRILSYSGTTPAVRGLPKAALHRELARLHSSAR